MVCGVWGTIAVGFYGENASSSQLFSQFVGILAIGVFTVLFSIIVLSIIKLVIGLRVSASHEEDGLDKSEHKDMSYFYSHTNS